MVNAQMVNAQMVNNLMRAKVLGIIGLLAASIHAVEVTDSVWLPDVEVSVSRIGQASGKAPMQVTSLDSRLLEDNRIETPKDLSALAPNIYMPDYGSAMTSSIYIRGLGSRINEPVLAMVVDGVPLTDKNLYDHTLQDICRIELLRGPQGSLYGRNSPAGVMEIRTIRPLDLTTMLIKGQATLSTTGFKGLAEQAQFSVYRPENSRFGWGLAARYSHTDGYYVNTFTDRKIDFGQQAGGRLVLDAKPDEAWRITGTVYADWLRQGAFPYAAAETGIIAYNREASYERLAVLPSLQAEYRHNGYRLNLTASYQFLHDDMHMDQDYTTADIFTLRQARTQHNATLDALLRGPKPCEWYEWQVGLSCFGKTDNMSAPVTFMREGIEDIILGNANRGIQTVFPEDSIEISNPTLPIPGLFGLYNAGAAVYHRSRFSFGRWHINAGLRLDYEYAQMDYLSTADVNYRFTLLMTDYKDVHTRIEGTRHAHYLQALPRLAVSYEAEQWMVYGYAAKGYKAGGYNPQIFSTVTQNQVMTDLAADMGMHLNIADPRFTNVDITSYKPERDWTFELGSHYSPVSGMRIDLDVFHIQCFDQQVTVFPNGKTTGRMMANAARSRIWGAEAALRYGWEHNRWSGWVDASYGFTDARFIDFNDGMSDYSGHFIPYAPQHTLHGLVAVKYTVGKKALQGVSLTLRTNMVGTIYWNEQNDRRQAPYATLAATLKLSWQHVRLQLWGKNLTDTPYDVFYFRSMDNDFLQRGKPVELGATVQLEL